MKKVTGMQNYRRLKSFNRKQKKVLREENNRCTDVVLVIIYDNNAVTLNASQMGGDQRTLCTTSASLGCHVI